MTHIIGDEGNQEVSCTSLREREQRESINTLLEKREQPGQGVQATPSL
jgi:hypothetical protein